MKKLLKFAVIGAAVFGLVASASAATYTVNMCGASAQAGFWQKAGAAVVQSAFDCSSAAIDGDSGKEYLIVRGLECTADDDGTNNDTVYVRYHAVSSSHGCQTYACGSDEFAKASSCNFSTSAFDCSETESGSCMMGCADVACDTITATSEGYYHGRKGYVAEEDWEEFGNEDGYPGTYSKTYKGVIVPFGFIVNNSVTDSVCVYDSIPTNAHLAYDKRGWECDPDDVPACRGDYKCLDTDSSGTGVCLDGKQDSDLDATFSTDETECTTAADCKMNSTNADTVTITCEAEPLKNISRLMALHIFGNKVFAWSDFGPSFPENLPIVKCMRHGGSGTHQTLINTVFRSDETVWNTTIDTSRDESYVWHYKSSSDLTRDCVAYYAGGIGYVDADKAMDTNKIDNTTEPTDYTDKIDGIHQLMYQGAAPSRNDVSWGKYNFWAAQQCFVNTNTGSCHSTVTTNIMEKVMEEAAKDTYLAFDNFGQRAYFWATSGEMQVEKGNEYAYPSRK